MEKYAMQIMNPSAQKILDKLVKRKFITLTPMAHESIPEEWIQNAKELAAAIKGDLELPSIYDILNDIEEEQKIEKSINL